MTAFKGKEAIRAFFEVFDSWLSESVVVYFLGCSSRQPSGAGCHDLQTVEESTQVLRRCAVS